MVNAKRNLFWRASNVTSRAIIALMIFYLNPLQSSQDEIKIGITDFCPYTCVEGENRGFTVDIVASILSRNNLKHRFVQAPWARSVSRVKGGEIDGILVPAKLEIPELLYPEEEIGFQNDCFYTNKDDPWVPEEVESFNNRLTIIFRNWSHEKIYQDRVGQKKYSEIFYNLLYGKTYNFRAISMLRLRRVDGFWQDRQTFNYFKKNNPSLPGIEQIKEAGCIASLDLYLGLSPVNEERAKWLQKIYDDGIRELRRSGGLQTILDKYDASDWK